MAPVSGQFRILSGVGYGLDDEDGKKAQNCGAKRSVQHDGAYGGENGIAGQSDCEASIGFVFEQRQFHRSGYYTPKSSGDAKPCLLRCLLNYY
jgi:hypothetical protein